MLNLPRIASIKGERLFRPVKVVSTTGNVTNAQALVSGRGGYTTLTMENGGIAPMVILDYGRVVGGCRDPR